MRITVSEARARLGQLCAEAQDPRRTIVLTRHGRELAAIVSIEEVRRIWALQDDAWFGRRNPLTGRRRGGGLAMRSDLTVGPDGKPVTPRAAAEQVREVQMTRAEERRLLEAGGLAPVEGGEIGAPVRLGWLRRIRIWRLWIPRGTVR